MRRMSALICINESGWDAVRTLDSKIDGQFIYYLVQAMKINGCTAQRISFVSTFIEEEAARHRKTLKKLRQLFIFHLKKYHYILLIEARFNVRF